MTDFEINKAVCATKGVKIDDEQYEGLCDRDERIVLCRDELDMSIGVDYCNNPSDAWPIIIESNIGLAPNDNGVWHASKVVKVVGNSCLSHKTVSNYASFNPLRAAMIVHLMMNEGK